MTKRGFAMHHVTPFASVRERYRELHDILSGHAAFGEPRYAQYSFVTAVHSVK